MAGKASPHLLHKVGDLDLAPRHTLHYDTQFTENGQVLQVTEVQRVDAQARWSKTLLLFAACVERWEGRREEGRERGKIFDRKINR